MKRYTYIILSLSLLLPGCDFFYSEVEYKGKEAEPRLCVVSHIKANSSMARVDVLHSEFFLNAAKDSLPVLRDALVTLKRNNDAPVPLVYVPGNDTFAANIEYGFKKLPYGHYEAPISFSENDIIRLHVEHPEYGLVYAEQVCPQMPYFELQVDSLSVYNEVYGRLYLPAYKGKMTDVLALKANMEGNLMTYIYSRDPVFATYPNYQTTSGYYGGRELYLPVSDQPREIQVILDRYTTGRVSPVYPSGSPSFNPEGPDTTKVSDKITMSIDATSHTIDSYQYINTLMRVAGDPFGNYVPDMTSERAMRQNDQGMEFDIAEIFNIISEEFNVLGNAEGYQVYINLTGKNKQNLQPFGCFRATNWYTVTKTIPRNN